MSEQRIFRLTMPKWGLSMTEGRIVAWRVDEGAEVAPGAEVVDIETDKIASAVEAPGAGILRRKVAAAGETVPVGGLVGIIAEADVPDDEIGRVVAEFEASFTPEAAESAEAGPEPETVEVAGRALRYLRRGEGGVPALLIHGFGGDLDNWLFNHEPLAASRAVYAIDLPGHGGSSKEVGEGSVPALAEAVAGAVQALSAEPLHLVGHSLGGAVALWLALARPERVRSLTLVGSAGLGPEIDSAYVEGFIAAARRKELKPHLEKLFAKPALVTRQMVEDVLRFKRLDGVEAALRTIAAAAFANGRQSLVLRQRLAEIEAPILVVWGEADRIVPVAHARGLPPSVRAEVIPGAGHMVQMEAAARVNELVAALWSA